MECWSNGRMINKKSELIGPQKAGTYYRRSIFNLKENVKKWNYLTKISLKKQM